MKEHKEHIRQEIIKMPKPESILAERRKIVDEKVLGGKFGLLPSEKQDAILTELKKQEESRTMSSKEKVDLLESLISKSHEEVKNEEGLVDLNLEEYSLMDETDSDLVHRRKLSAQELEAEEAERFAAGKGDRAIEKGEDPLGDDTIDPDGMKKYQN